MPNKIKRQILNYLLVIIGTFLLAFGSVIFYSRSDIVAGGLSGIGIIVNHYTMLAYGVNVYDYVVGALTAIFWLLGLIFIGKDLAIKTLLSSIIYIGFSFVFNRIPFFITLAETFSGTLGGTTPEVGHLILCGLFGGIFVGGGVAITFLGGGSTGGVDIIQLIIKKYTGLKESISSVIVDGLIIVIGMACLQNWIPALCGIMSSIVAAMLIEGVYIRNQTSYQVDIISEKWEEISRYAQDELERGATIIRAEGGYKGEERVILRVVFDKAQYEKIRAFIASVDPKAFVTFTQTNAVFGEGFKNNRQKAKKKKK